MATHSPEVLLRYLKIVLDSIYGEERYELSYNKTFQEANAIIYYPHITITNTVEKVHDIYDLYVNFKFNIAYGTYQLLSISPSKSTFAPEEIINSSFYIHSHFTLSSNINDFIEDGGFCTGHTLFSKFLYQMKIGTKEANCLPQLFYSFNAYLEWESLEGTPYATINNLNNDSFLVKHCPAIDCDVITSLTKETINIMDSFVYSSTGKGICISDLDKYIEEAGRKIKLSNKFKSRIIGEKDRILRKSKMFKRLTKKWNGKEMNFTFKSSPVIIKINDCDLEEVRKKYPLQVHSAIKNRIKDIINEEFLKYMTLNYKNY